MIWLICLAGGLGALARAGVDELAKGRPWVGTLLINVLGSFALGWSVHALPEWAGLAGGLFGGFTTFSTASYQAAMELRKRRLVFGIGYAAATVSGCLLAAAAGTALAA